MNIPHKLSLFLLSVLYISNTAFAQTPHCFTNEYFRENFAHDSQIVEQVQLLRQQISSLAALKTEGEGDVYTIPVVVHIIYNNDSENLSDDRIHSQIQALNEDFRRLNSDSTETPAEFLGVAADAQIEFCLAIFDPNGDTTNGITRSFTDMEEFALDSKMKRTSEGGIDAWDADSYLNIWVCDLPDEYLGFSSLPGYPDADDGVVINYKFFGDGFGAFAPYNLGRTCTHEIAHYLGLQHIWGDDGGSCSGSDLMPDTPNQAGENYGCPSFPLTDACTTDFPGVMFMNYMDYTDDGCMNLFTQSQKTAMRTTIETTRSSLLLSAAGCNDIVPLPGAIAELLVSPNPVNDGMNITVTNFEGSQLQFAIYNSLGQLILVHNEEPAIVANEYFNFSSLEPGVYYATAFNGNYVLSTKFIVQ